MKKVFYTFIIFTLSCTISSAQRQRNTQIDQEFTKLGTALSAINNFYVEEINNAQLVEEAIKAMLQKLDPHSTYTNAEETRRMNEPLEANFDGIGIQFDMLMDTLYIVQVTPGGPSEKVGLLAGDRIIMVDDTIIAGVKMSNSDVIRQIRGKKGTTVRIYVKRDASPELLEFIIIRDRIPYYSIDATFMSNATTGYIRLSRFSASTLEEFKTAVSELQEKGMKNLILDLQGNGGGYLQTAFQLADQFIEKGKLLVYTQGDRMPRQNIFSTDLTFFKDGKLVILINEGSASASEIVAGAIQDWDRGVIVGRRSFGKGLVQRAIELPDSSMIRLTVARYYTPSGRHIQKPYEKGNSEAYRHDIIDRMNKGELTNVDSIHFPDSLKFQTLLSNRTVYGGGGIMPDVFVPYDTTLITDYHFGLRRYRVFNSTSLGYLDKHRKELTKNYPDISKFKDKFFITDAILQELVANAAKQNIQYDEEEFDKSKDLISLELKAYIASDLFGNSGYFQVMNDLNDSYQKALEIINDDEAYFNLLSGWEAPPEPSPFEIRIAVPMSDN